MGAQDGFTTASQLFADLVEAIPDGGWDRPGLGEWDLRSLVGHTSRALITVETYLDRPAEHEVLATPEAYLVAGRTAVAADPTAVAERGRAAGLALGEHPAAVIRALVERVVPRAAAPGDPLIETIGGGMRLSNYLPTRTLELVVHSHDIAAAADLEPPDTVEDLLADVTSLAARAAVLQGRGRELLLALTGRADLPAGFSVV